MFCYKSLIGNLYIEEENEHIVQISFFNMNTEEKETKLIKETCKQLSEYFAGQRNVFSIPILPKGTAFQKLVWSALCEIPYGETCSYKDIACMIGNPNASRAVGMANNKNPIAIIIPCHRVLGKNGDLTGYAGGLEIKNKLLKLEKRNI